MTTEHSTYTYKYGRQETVTLKRGPATPHGHALLKIEYSDGRFFDCYVNTAWLRDRLNDLGAPCPVPAVPRPLTPDAITDEMVLRALNRKWDAAAPRLSHYSDKGISDMRAALTAALTEPPKRPEGAEELEVVIGLNAGKWTDGAEDVRALADLLASKGVRAMEAE